MTTHIVTHQVDDSTKVMFEVEPSGGADWLVAKSAGEASFKITLTWTPKARPSDVSPDADGAGGKAGNDAGSGHASAVDAGGR